MKRTTFKSRDAARLALLEYIETFRNPPRRHSSLGYKSPVEFGQIYSAEMKEAAAA
jgi:putative transposase